MSILQTRVEDYTGTVADTTALTDGLTAGAKYILNLIPEQKLGMYSTEITDDGSGVAISNYRPLRAHKSGYPAIPSSAEYKKRFLDTESIYYAPNKYPFWYIEGGKAYVVPDGGTVVAVAYPTVTYSDSSITNFPAALEHGVVLYCAIQILLGKSNISLASLDALTIDSVSEPSAPADATYSYTDAVLGTYTATTIGDLGTVPTYTKPTTSFDITNATTYIGTEEDIEKASAEINKQATILEQYGKDLYNELNEFNKELEIYKSTVQKAITQAQLDQERLLTVGRDTTNLNIQNKVQALQGDIALYQSKLSKYQGQIESYGVQVNYAVQKLNAYIQKYLGEVQANTQLIEQLKGELQRLVSAI